MKRYKTPGSAALAQRRGQTFHPDAEVRPPQAGDQAIVICPAQTLTDKLRRLGAVQGQCEDCLVPITHVDEQLPEGFKRVCYGCAARYVDLDV